MDSENQNNKKSIIVIPFVNMSPDPDQEYFSDGLTEEIITDLSFIHDLLVISRNSAMTFKGSNKKEAGEIAKEVNVRYVLEGSVKKAGNNLRITAQLIDGKTDAHLWAEKYSGTLEDVFDIQEKVSKKITQSLRLKLSSSEEDKITEHAISDPKAFEYYLRAKQELWKCTQESLQRAIQYFNKGFEIIGDNILLFYGMGYIHIQFYHNGIDTDRTHLEQVEDYAKKIFKLDPNSPHGHRLLGILELILKGATTKCYYHLKKSYEIDPNDPDTILWLTYILIAFKGHFSLAEDLVISVFRIDPLTPVNQSIGMCYYWMQGNFDQGLNHTTTWCKMEPDSVIAHWYHAQMYIWNKKLNLADEVIDKMVELWPQTVYTKLIILFKNALNGKKDIATKYLTEELKEYARIDFHLPWFMSKCFALIGEKDEALKWLEYVIKKGWTNYPLFQVNDPFLENIRSEPRFKELMKRVKYEWEHFEV